MNSSPTPEAASRALGRESVSPLLSWRSLAARQVVNAEPTTHRAVGVPGTAASARIGPPASAGSSWSAQAPTQTVPMTPAM